MTVSPFSLLRRAAPVVVGSVLLHAGVALALVGTAPGHTRAGVALPAAALDVDSAEIASPTLEAAEVSPPEHAARREVAAHTHTYPVAPSHDAHPHDPSLSHDEALSVAPSRAHAASEPTQPAAALVADPGALPRFTIRSGAGPFTGGPVSANSGALAPAASGRAGGAGDDVVVPAAAVEVAARPVRAVAPTYPAGARADDREGEVTVELVVDRDGRVVEARVTRPAGHGFDEAALTAVRAYRFSPAQRRGRAVRVRMPWSVQFRLR